MFTGIVETMGTVESVRPYDMTESGGQGYAVTIGDASSVLGDCMVGDSIATNGVCLTVTEFDSTSFKVGIAPETLQRSNLGALRRGDKVNLERAVTGDKRLGGHVVQGHVDTVARITSIESEENTLRMTFEPRDQSVMSYIVEKGFIALEGASLTITKVTSKTFSVMLIAHTQKSITLGSKKVGDLVNVEVDVLGKIIAKQTAAGQSVLTTAAISAATALIVVIGYEFLKRR